MFLDFDYELSINTLSNSKVMSCSNNMNLNFDQTVYDNANFELEKRYNCTIPFLPNFISNITGVPLQICKDEEKEKF